MRCRARCETKCSRREADLRMESKPARAGSGRPGAASMSRTLLSMAPSGERSSWLTEATMSFFISSSSLRRRDISSTLRASAASSSDPPVSPTVV